MVIISKYIILCSCQDDDEDDDDDKYDDEDRKEIPDGPDDEPEDRDDREDNECNKGRWQHYYCIITATQMCTQYVYIYNLKSCIYSAYRINLNMKSLINFTYSR